MKIKIDYSKALRLRDVLHHLSDTILNKWIAEHSEAIGKNIPSPQVCWNFRRQKVAGMCYCRAGDIELSYAYFEAFGFERVEKTLRHELAHLIASAVYGAYGHKEVFKKICLELGGSLCAAYATGKYTACFTDQYINITKYVYTCKCGKHYRRSRRLSTRQIENDVCSRCRISVKDFTVVKLDG